MNGAYAPAARFQYGPILVPGDAGVPGVPSLDMLSCDSPGLNVSPIPSLSTKPYQNASATAALSPNCPR